LRVTWSASRMVGASGWEGFPGAFSGSSLRVILTRVSARVMGKHGKSPGRGLHPVTRRHLRHHGSDPEEGMAWSWGWHESQVGSVLAMSWGFW
jgi:hypothetical protein